MDRYIRIAITNVLLVTTTACGLILAKPLGQAGELATVIGLVQSVDTSPMAYDGPAEIILTTREHGRVRVLVQSCLGGCALGAVDQLSSIEVGQQWLASGEVQDRTTLLVYTDEVHLLQLVNQ